ncbi:MAG: helix-turn-helix domain-containing protein [Spirochaetes bacterium]|nr:helix-turn-helix domain-containing protein [Spirochaetota bacterium]
MDKKQLIKTNELSEIISIPPYTIRKMARRKLIPAYKVNNTFLFDKEEVINCIKESGKID